MKIRDRFSVDADRFLFVTVFGPAPRPTQSPIQMVPGGLSPGVKRPWRESNRSSPSSVKVQERLQP
jgi:hypothetical protein